MSPNYLILTAQVCLRCSWSCLSAIHQYAGRHDHEQVGCSWI